jgi:hypothetical protein
VPTGKSPSELSWQKLILAEVDTTTTPTLLSEDVTESYQSTSTFQDGESELCTVQTLSSLLILPVPQPPRPFYTGKSAVADMLRIVADLSVCFSYSER